MGSCVTFAVESHSYAPPQKHVEVPLSGLDPTYLIQEMGHGCPAEDVEDCLPAERDTLGFSAGEVSGQTSDDSLQLLETSLNPAKSTAFCTEDIIEPMSRTSSNHFTMVSDPMSQVML